MLAPNLDYLFLTLITTTNAIRIARVMPTPSNNPALMHRHDAYVNQKVYNDPHNILNHDAWYLRHARINQTLLDPLVQTNETRAVEVFATSTPQNPSGTANSANPILTLKAAGTIKAAINKMATPSTTVASNISDLIKALGMTEALVTSNKDEDDWDDQTNAACIEALQASQADAASSSGMAACYNVKSLNDTIGSFEAEVRLYQVSEPSAQWNEGALEGLSLGLNYANATVRSSPARKMRRESVDERPTQEPEMEKQTLERRSPRLKPRRLEMLELEGQVDYEAVPALRNMQVAFSILSPKMMLSGTVPGGSLVSAALSLQDASFVNGLFKNANATYPITKESSNDEGGDLWAYISATNTFTRTPTGLILTSIWIILVTIIWASELLIRVRIRGRYRQAVKEDRACRPSIISWN